MELLKAKVELFTVKLLLIRLVFYYFWFSWKPDLGGGIFLIVLADIISTFLHVFARVINNAINPPKKEVTIGWGGATERNTPEEVKKTNRELVLWRITEQKDLVQDENILCIDSLNLIAGIVLDFTNFKLCVYQKVGSNSDSPIELIIFPVSEILSLEVIEDGQTVSHSTTTSGGEIKTSSGSMLGRAVVGGVLLGGVGAIIGGATAKKTTASESVTHTNTVENVNEIKLKVLVNNTINPLISIPFLSKKTVKGSTDYTEASQKIERCEALIKVLMLRASQAKAAT